MESVKRQWKSKNEFETDAVRYLGYLYSDFQIQSIPGSQDKLCCCLVTEPKEGYLRMEVLLGR